MAVVTAQKAARSPQEPLSSDATTPPAVPVSVHNAILSQAQTRVDKLEPRLADIIEQILRDYGDIAARNFEGHVTDHLTAAGTADWTSPFADELIDVDALVAAILAKTAPIREALVRETMTPALEQAGLTWNVLNPLIAGQLANTAAQVTHIASTTRDNIMKIIGRAADSGLTIPQTSKLIREGMRSASTFRATMIARTELARAVNGSSLAATQMVSKETQTPYEKVWLTAPGAKWPRHEDYDGLDGQQVPLNELFTVGTAELGFPGDPDGPPDETIMCRCALSYADVAPAGTVVLPDGTVIGEPIPEGPPPGDTVSIGASPPVPTHLVNRINELNLDKPLDQFKPTSHVGQRIYKDEPDTQHIYAPAGVYTAERQKLHDEIIAAFFKDKVAPATPGENRFFTAGGGASGKSHAAFDLNGEEVTLHDLADKPDWIVVDPDAVKKMLPEYQALNKEGDLYAANGVHEESSEIAKAIVDEAEGRGFNIVNDTTGSSGSFLEKLDAAKAEGKNVQVSMFSIPTNRAIERSIARAENPDGKSYGRYVATRPLKKAHAGASRNLVVWKDSPSVDAWRVYDNSGAKPVIVAEKVAGEDPVIFNPDAFSDILGKSDETPGSAGATVEAPITTTPAPGVGGATERALMTPEETVENQTVSLDPGKQDIDDALASISRQLNSPDTEKPITAKVVGQITTARGSSAEGIFYPSLQGGSIQVRRLTDRYAVFTHEYGHAWDHLHADTSRTVPIIDPSGTVLDQMAETYASQNIQEAGLGEWYKAVTESPTYQKLWAALQDGAARAQRAGESLLGDDPVFVDGDPYLAGNVLYVLNEQELFARAFVQWLSGQDARLAEHVREKLALDHQELGAWYWPPKEFEPIAEAMTSYFRERGFIPGVPASPEYAAEVAARSAREAVVQAPPTMTVSEARAALVEEKPYDAVHSPLHAVGDEWYHSLGSEEEHVLDLYTRRGYMWMNARLKGDRYWKDEGEGSAPAATVADRKIAELHDAIEKAPPLPADTTLYRAWDPFESALKKEWDELPGGQRFDTPEERKLLMDWVEEHMPVGSEIQPAGGGFQSWTADSQFAAHFHGGSRVSVVYEVPNATHGASLFTINQSEREVLVSNDQHYIVKDMHFEDVPVEGPVSATMPSASPRLVVTLEEVPG